MCQRDRHGLLPGQPDEAVDDVHALFPVSIGQRVIKSKGGDPLPLSSGIVLHVPKALFIAAHLAQIMEQGHHCHTLLTVLQAIQLLDPFPGQIVHQTVVDIQAVVTQPAPHRPRGIGRRRGR